MEDGCEICVDEDLIEEITNGQLLILGKEFEKSNKQNESTKPTIGMKSCEGL